MVLLYDSIYATLEVMMVFLFFTFETKQGILFMFISDTVRINNCIFLWLLLLMLLEDIRSLCLENA